MVISRNRSYLLLVLVIVIDQLAKLAIRQSLALNESKVLIPEFLSLTYSTNTGAIFGMLRGMNTLLILVGLFIVIWLIYYVYAETKSENTSYFFALIIGGAISNLIDRIVYGSVIDFINFYFWPTFNIADSAITVGVIAIVIYYMKKS